MDRHPFRPTRDDSRVALDEHPPTGSAMTERELFRAYGETVDPPQRRPATVETSPGRYVRVAGECSGIVTSRPCQGEIRTYRIGLGDGRLVDWCASCAAAADALGATIHPIDSDPRTELAR